MCVIFHLDANTMPNKEKFTNAVYNNWHSWGIVVRGHDGKLIVEKGVPETKENDPEFLYGLLKKYENCERFLHIRHTTRGETNIENAHPFEIKIDGERTVYFMHNGTLNGFGNLQGGVNSVSDTKEFVDKVLANSLPFWNGPKGRGDYTDPNFKKLVLDKQWTTSSTSIFISDFADPMEYGNAWSVMADSEGDGNIRVSNMLYFNTVTRGPENDRRQAKKREEEAKNNASRFQDDNDYTYGYSGGSYGNFGRSQTQLEILDWDERALDKSQEVIIAMAKIHNDDKFRTVEGILNLKNLTFDEWVDFCNEESEYSIAYTLEHIVATLHGLNDDYQKVRKTLQRAQSQIAKIKIKEKEVANNDAIYEKISA